MERNLIRGHRCRLRPPAAAIIKTSKSNTSSACSCCFSLFLLSGDDRNFDATFVGFVISGKWFVRTRENWQTWVYSFCSYSSSSLFIVGILTLDKWAKFPKYSQYRIIKFQSWSNISRYIINRCPPVLSNLSNIYDKHYARKENQATVRAHNGGWEMKSVLKWEGSLLKTADLAVSLITFSTPRLYIYSHYPAAVTTIIIFC